MVNLEPAGTTAAVPPARARATLEAVTLEHERTEPRPAPIGVDFSSKPPGHHPATWIRGRFAGAARLRSPSPTARIATAIASSRAFCRRPPSVDFASFALPAGSVVTRASASAERIRSERPGESHSETTARRKRRTSSPPSLKPWPRTTMRVRGNFFASSASWSSPTRQRSHTIVPGRPHRVSTVYRSPSIDATRRPITNNSFCSAISWYSFPTPSSLVGPTGSAPVYRSPVESTPPGACDHQQLLLFGHLLVQLHRRHLPRKPKGGSATHLQFRRVLAARGRRRKSAEASTASSSVTT